VALFGREPVVVGIDLRGNPKNPTGWSRCEGSRVESRILHDDEQILAFTLSAQPDLVSIDAPLSLPRGRRSVSDDSPCREKGGIVRDAERTLWSRGIPVYPSLIRHMQSLTQRGITLADRLREHGIAVIESYPGAAQDILGIPRKRLDLDILRRGLEEFGFETNDVWTHDELDALTSALVGYFYLADQYEAIGAEDEGYMIIPRWTAAMRWSE
jgi:predicted nuclease with RNAse H fold